MTFRTVFRVGLLATASLVACAIPASADPISIALLTTVGFSSGAIGGTLLAATTAGLELLAGTALSIGMNMLSSALSEKPKGLGGSKAQVQIGADVPRQILLGRGATAGSVVYLSGRGQKNHNLTILFRLSDWECDGLECVWVSGDKRTLTPTDVIGTEHARYIVAGTSSKMSIRFFRGTMTQAADAALIADETSTSGTRIGAWTTNHRLAGICYAAVKFEWDEDAMPSVPALVFGLKGAKLYDWRKDSTNGGSGSHRWADPTTWEWTDNPAVCDYNFRRGFYRSGLRVLGMGVPSADLMLDYYTTAANVCDEALTEGGVTEKRYTVGVLVRDDSEWRVAVDAFRAAMAGEVIERAGSFGVIAGGSYSPVMTLTDDDMRADAPSTFSRKVPRSELYNAVTVSWANPAIRYESDTLTPLTSSAYEAQDNSERLVRDIDLSMVYKPYQARRIGSIILEQGRMQATHTGVYPARFSALEPGDWVTRSFNRDGLGDVIMKVVSIREVEPEWYEISLRQAAAANFTPPTGTLSIPTPPAVVQAPTLPGTPGTPALTETVALNGDGAAVSTITAVWTAGENARNYIVGVSTGGQEVEANVGGALRYAFTAIAGATYQVRVRSIDADGQKGDWSTAASIVLNGDTTPPAVPSGLAAAGSMGAILLTWTNPTDDDLAGIEVWEASANNLASATRLAFVNASRWTRTGLPVAAVRYYWIKAVDRSGNVSGSHPASGTAGVSGTAQPVTAGDIAVNELSAITADVGTLTAGLIRSGVSGMEMDLDNNRIQSGNFDPDALTGFQLDGETGTLTINNGVMAGGTSSKRPFELALGAVQDGILSDEGTANVYLPASLTGSVVADVFGSVRRLPTETVFNLQINPLSTMANVGSAWSANIIGGYPRAKGIACPPAHALFYGKSASNYWSNGFLQVTADGVISIAIATSNFLTEPNPTQEILGYLYNAPDADPLFQNSYDQALIHIWRSVLTGGIRRIRVPDTVLVGGVATPVAGLRVWMWGAGGQWGSGRQGGPGGYVKFEHAVVPGEILTLLVGAYNGDGWGGCSPNYVDGNNERGSTALVAQGGGGSFLWRGPTARSALLGVAGGGGGGGRLRNGGVGGSAAFAGGNGISGGLMNVCMGITSLGAAHYGSASGGGGYVGGGRLGTSNPDNEGGRGGANYIIGTATNVTNSSSVTSNQDANGAANTLTTQGTGETVYIANSTYTWGRANVGCASATESKAGPGMIAIQWLT